MRVKEIIRSKRFRFLGALASAGLIGVFLGAVGSGELQGAERPPSEKVAPPAPLPAPGIPLGMETFQGIAQRDDAAVVNISTSKVIHEVRTENPFFQFFGPGGAPSVTPWGHQGGETLTQRSLGSGFIVDDKGYILTNRHVVDDADEVTVTLTNGHHYKAKTVGQDTRTDIALLQIEPHEALQPLPFGDSSTTRVGEWVMAIGNPFGLGGNSVTVGVVSFKGRPLDLATRGTPIEMLQTDAAINPGNSGGPLINARGEVVGINTLIMTGGAQQYSGVGFAVPINVAREILPQLRETGHVVRGWLGVQIQDVDEDLAKTLKMKEAHGAIVSDVTAGSPADEAGLKPGDVVVALDGQPMEDGSDLSRHVASKGPDAKVALEILHDGSRKTVRATLGTFPDGTAAVGGASGTDHGYLGIAAQTLTPDLAQSLGIPPDTRGVAVVGVEPGGRADAAGLRERDVIVSVDGQPVTDTASLEAAVDRAHSEELMRLRVRRGNGYIFIVVRAS
ncbi:MAG: Do family serine endopeptidase [Acidobacteria bacterium]|jgi:serine protease Do|nr:Do family serine endopeptidase [Acidobacteriota bacterium]